MIVFKPLRHRPAPHHMSHGKIHENQKKAHRGDQSFFQNGNFVIRKSFRSLGCRGLLTVSPFRGGSVTGLLNSLYNILRGGASFHSHGIGEQADRAGGYPGNVGYSFFYPGAAGRTAHSCYLILFHISSFCCVQTVCSVHSLIS